jgi:hypothetical protein
MTGTEQRERTAMPADAIETLITNAIHTAFIKYPEGDGSPNMDYEWIPTEQSRHITKAILLDLEAGGYQIVKKT